MYTLYIVLCGFILNVYSGNLPNDIILIMALCHHMVCLHDSIMGSLGI